MMDLAAGSNVLCIYHTWIGTYTFITFPAVLLLNMCPTLGGIIVTPSFLRNVMLCLFLQTTNWIGLQRKIAERPLIERLHSCTELGMIQLRLTVRLCQCSLSTIREEKKPVMVILIMTCLPSSFHTLILRITLILWSFLTTTTIWRASFGRKLQGSASQHFDKIICL